MKKLIFFLFVSTLFIFSSCDDDAVLGDTSTVNLNFTAVFSGDPLVFQNSEYQYKYPAGNQIMFSDLKFFISEVALLEEEGGDEAELIDIQNVNFSNNTTLAEAERAISFSLPNIPSGKYKALKIGIGVPADLNNENYSQYGENHPLRKNSGEYWSGWQSFIFMKINAVYDIDSNDIGNGTDASLGHHLGGNQFYKIISLSKPITLEPDQEINLDIELDLAKLYESQSGEYLDLTNSDHFSTHDQSKVGVITFLTNNYERAFTLK